MLWRVEATRLDGRVFLYFLVCIFICISGLIIALYFTENPDDVSRGGNLCIMLSFYSLFANRVSQLSYVESFRIGHTFDEHDRLGVEKMQEDYFNFKRIILSSISLQDALEWRSRIITFFGGAMGAFFSGFGDIIYNFLS